MYLQKCTNSCFIRYRVDEKERNPENLNPVFQYDRDDAGLGEHCSKTLIQTILADWKGMSVIFQYALLLRDYIEGRSDSLAVFASVLERMGAIVYAGFMYRGRSVTELRKHVDLVLVVLVDLVDLGINVFF